MSVASSPRLNRPAAHIITIILIPQPSIIMTNPYPSGVQMDAPIQAPVPGTGMETRNRRDG
jgi:hypothetical protein